MVIRPAAQSDARDIAELLLSIPDYPNFAAMGFEALHARVVESMALAHDQQNVLVCEIDGRVVAYASIYWMTLLFSAPEGYISELFVSADASGRGIGSALLDEMKRLAKAKGCERITLINLSNRESYHRQFYANRGWEERPTAVRFVMTL
jgi:GNAT superfamily N-acetyltransferase